MPQKHHLIHLLQTYLYHRTFDFLNVAGVDVAGRTFLLVKKSPRNYPISRAFVCFYTETCARDRTRTYTSHDTRS